MADRDTKRLQKQAERDRRVADLHRRFPALADLDRAIRQAGIRLVQGALRRLTPDEVAALTEERSTLFAQKRALLREYGIDEQVYAVRWDCARCQDRGWTDFGVKCACLVQEEIDGAFARSGLTDEMRRQTFGSFDLNWYTMQPGGVRLAEKMERVRAICQQFAHDIVHGGPVKNLLFYGPVGTGKTHLSSAIANVLVAERKSVVYGTISQVISTIYEAKFDFQNKGRQPEVLAALRKADLVIIDDLGTENTTESVVTELFELVNDRVRFGKPLLISTNLALPQLPGRYSLRTMDRLLTQSICVEFEGSSVRELRFARR
ncbi:ATP-binding protein [Heliophilum fasciatum]|uniref:DNA replication protein DnaC n=1 Tax=Heliophilum fasciatum TaxID=35700 RepID=A0A4R2RLU2_9FIRM|nr:ATP-binding protein [Heliophilum fasciatum]MCW2278243.1 DNA replication protein DnaC [Heliophilum fasciatum]TCP63868.1 DNA replication protein DnaC [Heliophilum fasciatum]